MSDGVIDPDPDDQSVAREPKRVSVATQNEDSFVGEYSRNKFVSGWKTSAIYN